MRDFAVAQPSPALSGHVVRYVGARVRGAEPQRAAELPVAGTTVILGIDGAWWIRPDATRREGRFRSFAGGLALGPAFSRHEGGYELIQLDLTPLGTQAVLGVPGATLAGEVVELEDLLGAEAGRLVDRLAEHDRWSPRFALLDAWLRRRVERGPRLRPDVAWACRRIEASGGRVGIAALQTEIGCSRRHLATRFGETVGLPPKAYARLVRFNRAAALLRERRIEPARVAAACGYADQAHLNREVRAIGQTTPAALVRAGSPVTSVQD